MEGGNSLSRRQFLEGIVGTAGVLTLNFGPRSSVEINANEIQNRSRTRIAENEKEKRPVIGICLCGGMSQIEFLDPHPEAPSAYQSGIGAVRTSTGTQIAEVFPEIGKLAHTFTTVHTLYSEDSALDHTTHTKLLLLGEDGSNFQTQLAKDANVEKHKLDYLYMEASFPGRGFGFGNVLNEVFYANDSVHEVGRKFVAPFRDGEYHSPLEATEEARRDIRRRMPLLGELDRMEPLSEQVLKARGFTAQAIDFLLGGGTAAFGAIPEKKLSCYGDNQFGRAFYAAGRLAAEGVPSVLVRCGHWDFHDDIRKVMIARAPWLDHAFSSLLLDIENGEIERKPLIWCASEFGREPSLWNTGRSHHTKAHSGILYGGKFRRGYVFGETNAEWRAKDAQRLRTADVKNVVRFAAGYESDGETVRKHAKLFDQ